MFTLLSAHSIIRSAASHAINEQSMMVMGAASPSALWSELHEGVRNNSTWSSQASACTSASLSIRPSGREGTGRQPVRHKHMNKTEHDACLGLPLKLESHSRIKLKLIFLCLLSLRLPTKLSKLFSHRRFVSNVSVLRFRAALCTFWRLALILSH